jgi:hypothetical protein
MAHEIDARSGRLHRTTCGRILRLPGADIPPARRVNPGQGAFLLAFRAATSCSRNKRDSSRRRLALSTSKSPSIRFKDASTASRLAFRFASSACRSRPASSRVMVVPRTSGRLKCAWTAGPRPARAVERRLARRESSPRVCRYALGRHARRDPHSTPSWCFLLPERSLAPIAPRGSPHRRAGRSNGSRAALSV